MKEREVRAFGGFSKDAKKTKCYLPGRQRGKRRHTEAKMTERSVMGELEERMAWLTEDKERELQELSAEMSKVMVTLHQGVKEKEQLLMRLDEREREGEELKEKLDELQMKLLEMERMGAMKEQERKEREAEIQHAHLDEMNEIQNKLLEAEKENNRMRGKVEETQKRWMHHNAGMKKRLFGKSKRWRRTERKGQ